jgi:hypothetical protein
MTPQEKFGQCTAEGCNKALMQIFGLNDNVTIGELRKFLEKQIETDTLERDKKRTELFREWEGKCFKIVYDEGHRLLLKVDRLEILNRYGEVSAAIQGEELYLHDETIQYSRLTIPANLNNAKYLDQYIDGNYPYTEVPRAFFDDMKSRFESIKL